MERLGFIHDKLDIKILILYILRRLPGVVGPLDLQDFTQQCDEGFGYFEYSDCLAELIEKGLILEVEDGLRISEKGSNAGETVESSIPFSVRKRADKIIAPEAERLRRLAMLTAEHVTGEDGCIVTLAMKDGKGVVMHLDILCSGDKQAARIEENYKHSAETIYKQIIELLDKE